MGGRLSLPACIHSYAAADIDFTGGKQVKKSTGLALKYKKVCALVYHLHDVISGYHCVFYTYLTCLSLFSRITCIFTIFTFLLYSLRTLLNGTLV